ncbi:MAG: glycoside hydrolase family 2 protein [Chloroflexi bacterium]|uniref:beta-mannosidase n=1 Tax=Candidatus Flexifilum breve TaxID=3140694 RepID=UPI0031362A1E|nr:glycoside hydrolase family 2 protein [Chloroflexota bacterium]
MAQLTLNGAWTLYKQGDPTPIPATVPGCVHTDLLAHGLLDDPFYRDNELKQMWIGETDWHYARTFTVAPEFLAHDRVLLRCHGLDTLATIRVNGVEIGRADNMFRTWDFDVKSVLQVGENTIEVAFAAAMTYACQMDAEKGEWPGWVEPMRINSGAWIRKEPCNFGWDWGPKMVTSGIWRAIELVTYEAARLSDVLVTQHHDNGEVSLTVKIAAEVFGDAPIHAAVQVLKEGAAVTATMPVVLTDGAGLVTLRIPDPHLWWVNGLGEQPLYEVKVGLFDNGDGFIDTWTKRIGLRTLTLERHPDEWGESFYFACNGVPFFAKGANWIPASPYPWEPQYALYQMLISAAADVHMNMLRVWGGGVYEDDAFYALCDEYGIAIWQDFMFACGTYPTTDAEFMANVKAEATDNIKRLRHHPCMALWCGNNEIEQGMGGSGWQSKLRWDDYGLLWDKLLPELVAELAPQTAYWPGSPHTPIGDRNDHMNPAAGDTHLWGVWHGKQPFEWYHTRPDRFVSEFGFQSFPEPATVYEYTLPQDRNITSYVMEHHQRSGIGNSTIIHYLLDWFRLSTSFDGTLWLSQILQGMAMKYAVEGWRRNMPRSMGALYWQLNDMWPAPSWSSLDWKGNWKALHYMARRFFAPLLITGVEDEAGGTVHIHATNDQRVEGVGEAEYVLTTAHGEVLEHSTFPVRVTAGTTAVVGSVDVRRWLDAYSPRDLLMWVSLRVDGAVISEDLVTFCRPKHLELAQPSITLDVHTVSDGEFDVTLTTDAAALYVWLELANAKFSDNFVHLRPGTPKTIRVRAQDAADLKVRSLVDTY